MRRLCQFILCSLLILSSLNLAAAEKPPAFKKTIPTDSVQFVSVFSDDAQAASILFSNFLIGTEIGKGSLPSVVTKRFVYALPTEGDKDSVVTQHIRGFVSTQGSASAAILIHSGGVTTPVDIDKAIKAAKANTYPQPSATFAKAQEAAKAQGVKPAEKPARSDDYFIEVVSRVPAGKPLQTTIEILVDRLPGDDGSGAALFVDSIDAVIKPANKKK